MTDEAFEQLVSEGVEQIPERFLRLLNNFAVVIADLPTDEQLKENHVPDGDTLLGLYEGIPLTERGDAYGTGAVLPDKITIFKFPILEEARGIDHSRWDELPSEETIRKVVRDTVWHEVAHYFGYGDEEIERREDEGTNYSTPHG